MKIHRKFYFMSFCIPSTDASLRLIEERNFTAFFKKEEIYSPKALIEWLETKYSAHSFRLWIKIPRHNGDYHAIEIDIDGIRNSWFNDITEREWQYMSEKRINHIVGKLTLHPLKYIAAFSEVPDEHED